MPAPAAQAWVGERLCGLRASGGGFDRKRSECLFARAARGGRGRRGHPVGVCSAFVVWTHPQPLNERCNVTGGGEGGELRNGQGGASVSSAPDCLPPSRVTIHQSRVIRPLTCTWVWSVPLPPRVPPNPAHPLSVAASVDYIPFSCTPLLPVRPSLHRHP